MWIEPAGNIETPYPTGIKMNTIEREPSTEIWIVAAIKMEPNYIRWTVRDADGLLFTGSNPLTSTNGCYDSLLSNSVNEILKNYNIDEFLFSRG